MSIAGRHDLVAVMSAAQSKTSERAAVAPGMRRSQRPAARHDILIISVEVSRMLVDDLNFRHRNVSRRSAA